MKRAPFGAPSFVFHPLRCRVVMYYRQMAFGRSDTGHGIVAGVPILHATREQCPVCGHPTGDCAGDSGPPNHVWGLGDVPSMKDQQTVLVEEDIFEERQISPFTTSKVLVARAGQHIPLAKASELGII